MKGRNGSTSFLSSKRKGGFQKEIPFEQCLTKDQTKHIFDKIETGEEIRIRKLVQQIIPDLSKQETFANNINQYEKALLSDKYTRRSNVQMDQWLILSDNIVYVKSKDRDIMNGIDIKSIDYREHKRMYRKMNKESFPISEQGFVKGKLINGEECQILLDTGASKSYMSKSYYLRCKSLHNLPKFASKTQRIQVGNGQYVGVLFVIPVIVEINKHRLEMFTLVSEIFDNVDMVLGIKNLFEL